MIARIAPQDRMFFIVGRGRSGTTLLRAILDAHPAISVAPEGLFILYLYRGYRGRELTDRTTRDFAEQVFLEARMRRWKLDPQELGTRLASIADERTFARLCAEVYEAWADASGKAGQRLLGDKNPHYALFTEELAQLFPAARFVHVVRDYRDNLLSYRNVPFDVASPAALAYRWREYNVAILRAARRWPERFHRLRYEDLVAGPAPTLAALCDFLGVAPDHAVLRGHKRENGPELDWHRHVRLPIDAELAGQWRLRMPPDQIRLADRICQPLGSELGYAPAGPLGAAWRDAPGMALGWAITRLERLVFRFPVSLQAMIINSYRRLTGNVIR